jgi:hypothetical protein
MALAVHVAGKALIQIDAGAGLESLGYTINGVEISDDPFFSDVPSDENGGDEGPPIDVQFFGFVATIRIELSRWDSAVAAKIHPFLAGGTAGVQGTSGTLMSGNAYRLLILPTNLPRNYPVAFPSEPQEINKGTKYSRLAITWKAYGFTSATVWNTTVV